MISNRELKERSKRINSVGRISLESCVLAIKDESVESEIRAREREKERAKNSIEPNPKCVSKRNCTE